MYRDFFFNVDGFASSGIGEFFLLFWFDPVGDVSVLFEVELAEDVAEEYPEVSGFVHSEYEVFEQGISNSRCCTTSRFYHICT